MIRVRIADFSRPIEISSRSCVLSDPAGEYILPEKFTAVFTVKEALRYRYRLFHCHQESEAEKRLKSICEYLGDKFDIVTAGEGWEGRGIKRFWIVTDSFNSKSGIEALVSGIKSNIKPEYSYKVDVEGGFLIEYPVKPVFKIELLTTDGKIIESGEIIRLKSSFGIKIAGAPVGETFHWEHEEDLSFTGTLELRGGENGILVINEIPLEDYLTSVNSSEMSKYAPIEFLKAQTIAARGTFAATKGCHHYGEPFDLCNGDHCQCYYGTGRTDERSEEAASLTQGEVLLFEDTVADTRYAKICGGMMETFNNVWEDFNPGCLQANFDGEGDFKLESAEAYINDSPKCWCNPEYFPYPDYFDYARGLFRWNYELEKEALAGLISQRTGNNPGAIHNIECLERGKSGRLKRINISGELNMTVNGELKIRRLLSETHLPSSCFYIESSGEMIKIRGAGWGHGVGMCQLGGLNMALAGRTCSEILSHYYPGGERFRLF